MSQQAAETSDAYTVVVFRGSSSKPLRFSFPRKFVRKLLILAAILVVADLLVISHYVIRTGEVWQLSAFRAEAMGAREQTAAFSAAIDDLKKRLSTMGEVNQRLRVMLGIDASKPAGDLANGRGGEDGPLPDGKTSVQGNGSATSGLEPRQQVSEARDANQSEVDFATESIEEVTQQVRESLEGPRPGGEATRGSPRKPDPSCRAAFDSVGVNSLHLACARMGDLGVWPPGFAVHRKAGLA
ncbi:MAG: hypothetical protein IPL14_04695 [Nitrospira sp.]|nr:hypothetical protein [Nitrospira sp.]